MAKHQTPQVEAQETVAETAPVQSEPVSTGLAGLEAPPATPAEPEAPPPSTEPISFEEPPSQLAETALVTDEKPADFVDPTPLITPEQMVQLQTEAHRDDQKRDFFQKVMEARKPAPEPAAPPPIAPGVLAQTNAEIEAGRKMNEHHAALQARHHPRPAGPEEVGSKPVFRPADYVPDQKKNQGHVQARAL